MTIVGPYLRSFPLIYIFKPISTLCNNYCTIRTFGQAKYLPRHQYLEPCRCQPFPMVVPTSLRWETVVYNQSLQCIQINVSAHGGFTVSYYTLQLVYGRHQKTGLLAPSPYSHSGLSEHPCHINCSTTVEVHDNTVQSNQAGYFSNTSPYLCHFATCPWIEFFSRSFSCFHGSNCFIRQSAKSSVITYIAIAILHSSSSNNHNPIIKTFNVLY
jgi:hypothetical protein